MRKTKSQVFTNDFCQRDKPLSPMRQREASQIYVRQGEGRHKAKKPHLVFEAIC
ncbi:MAG: hypothetical protein ABIQ90_03860 [Polaromonas sp.]